MKNDYNLEQQNNTSLLDAYVHDRLDEVIVSRRATHQELNEITRNLAFKRLRQ